MKKYLTIYQLDLDKVSVFDETNYKTAPWDTLDDYVWQYAPDAETAKKQHFQKLDEWETNPFKEVY